MYITPVDYYSGLNFESVYADWQSVQKCFLQNSSFVMNTQRCTPQLNDYIIFPDEQTSICFENAKQALAEYENREKYKAQPKDFLYKRIPIWSRFDTALKLAEQKDYTSALTMASLAIMFGPEDLRDVSSAVKQIKSFIKGDNSFVPDYDYKTAQHPGSFFRGSILHNKMNPFAPNSKFVEEKMWLLEKDKAWVDTKFGKKVLKYFDLETVQHKTPIEEVAHLPNKKRYVKAYQFVGKNTFGKLTARALTRTPVLGTIVDAGIEGLQARHDIKQGENPIIALFKTGCRFITSTVLTAFCGAIGSYFGPVGTIAGLTIANYASNKFANAFS